MVLLNDILLVLPYDQEIVIAENRWISWERGHQDEIILGYPLMVTRKMIENNYKGLMMREVHGRPERLAETPEKIVIRLKAEKARTPELYGAVALFDRDWDGLSVKHKNGCYYSVTGDDMLEYEISENIPDDFVDLVLTQEEREWFLRRYYQIRSRAKHRDYYDASDNTWKNYDD